MTLGEIVTLIGITLTMLTFVITQVIQIKKSGEEKGRIKTELEYIKKNVEKTNTDLCGMRQYIKEELKEFKNEFTIQMECAIKNAKQEVKQEVKQELKEEISKVNEDVAVLKHSVKKAHERIDKVVKEKNK